MLLCQLIFLYRCCRGVQTGQESVRLSQRQRPRFGRNVIFGIIIIFSIVITPPGVGSEDYTKAIQAHWSTLTSQLPGNVMVIY